MPIFDQVSDKKFPLQSILYTINPGDDTSLQLPKEDFEQFFIFWQLVLVMTGFIMQHVECALFRIALGENHQVCKHL